MHTKITYRPEIDGLRAIAVFAVIFYHSESELFDKFFFPGGFIGVDIFFVISGYLITSLILKELIQTNSFSFLNFFERRVRRIIPALLTVIIFSLPLAWFYLMPEDLLSFSNSILYTLGFSSNYYFHFTGVEYNAQSSLLKPFLHTWSLAVEEQFYIFFPLILLLTFKHIRKYILVFLIILFLISLLSAEIMSKENISLSFYSLHTRFWELLAGSILAVLETKNNRKTNNKIFSKFFPILGLVLIFYSFFYFNDKLLIPSLLTIIPIIGVCLIIWFTNKESLITRILSSKPFVKTGLISYSLYLWHFPVFAFAKIIEFTEGDLLKKALLIIITILLSKITYDLIETKFRNKVLLNQRKLKSSLMFSIVFIAAFNLSVLNEKGYKNRLPEILLTDSGIELLWKSLKNEKGKLCWKNIDDICVFNEGKKKKIIIIGDSQIGSLAPDLKNKLLNKNFEVKVILFGACWYLPDFNRYEANGQLDKFCNAENQNKIRKILLNSQDSIIITGGRLPLYLTAKYFDNNEGGVERRIQGADFGYFKSKKNLILDKTIRYSLIELLKNNHKLVLIYPIPEVGWNVPKKINSNWVNRFFNDDYKKKITTSYDIYKSRTAESFQLLDSIDDKNVYRIYPHKIFCNTKVKDRCFTHDEKFIFYADDDHPSKIGAELINNLIIKEIDLIKY
tara:strand:+ start:317 stop:2350 length:2034 start_codon:yes stop_codon:yes gene_type:complete